MNFSFPTITHEFYVAAMPVLILCVGSIIAMLQSVFKRVGSPTAVMVIMLASLVGAGAAAICGTPAVTTFYLEGGYLAGTLGQFGQVMIVTIAIAVALLFRETYLAVKFFRGEISSLFLMIVTGMLVMVASEDLITLFVGLELSSIGLYAVVGYLNPTRRSQEGAIKYFVLGSFAAALLLFGFALLYAATGSMRLTDIVEAIPKLTDLHWIRLGVVFAISGLGFKLALAPFHLWAPDTYEAAPTGITAFMATTVKVMILIVAMRIFSGGLAPIYDAWMPAMMFLAMVSMIVGNIMALVQSSLKRMLAYSSIAHSGYMAIAVCALGGQAGTFPVAAILYYIVGYAIVSIGAFAVLMWLESESNDNLLLDDLAGLSKTHPWAAFALTVFMFSFAGMPPTVGFMGKFFVFNAALTNHLNGLVVIGVIGSAISLFYYLRVIVKMYMSESVKVASPLAPAKSLVVGAILAIALVLAILLGTVLPGRAIQLMDQTASEMAVSHH